MAEHGGAEIVVGNWNQITAFHRNNTFLSQAICIWIFGYENLTADFRAFSPETYYSFALLVATHLIAITIIKSNKKFNIQPMSSG